MVDETTITLKVPQWPLKDARKEFPTWKVRMESYLNQKECGEVLTWDENFVIPAMSKTWDQTEIANGTKDEDQRIQKLNSKACGCLIQAIVTVKDEGMVIQHQVEKTMTADYPAGHFYKAYTKSIKSKFEEKDSETKADLLEEYYGMKMEHEEDPSVFVMKMEKLLIKLQKNHGHKIEEVDFMASILAKLPKDEKDADAMNPYQVEKRLIEKEMEKAKKDNTYKYDLDHLVMDLDQVYHKMHKSPVKDKEEKALTGFVKKQFKGKCNKCGRYGHKAADC